MKLAGLIALASAVCCTSASEIALYWGQGGGSTLGDYCSTSAGDIFLVSFLYQFGSGRQPGLEVGGCNGADFAGTALPQCSSLGADIKTCQGLGKKVFLSLGGASGSYGFSSTQDAQNGAQEVWDLFGGGSSDTRPFGDAVVDGFDLDIESTVGAQFYSDFVNELRSLYSQDTSKSYFVSAAPQCPYPDQSIGPALDVAQFDYLFIQFYNNYCALTNPGQFNWDTWQSFAESTSPNKGVKLFLGLPGATSAAGSGYADPATLTQGIQKISSSSNFGGVMLWDASRAESNIVEGTTYDKYVRKVLDGDAGSASSSTSASNPASSSTSGVAPVSTATLSSATSAGSAAPTLAGSSSGAPVALDESAVIGTSFANGTAPAASTPAAAPATQYGTVTTTPAWSTSWASPAAASSANIANQGAPGVAASLHHSHAPYYGNTTTIFATDEIRITRTQTVTAKTLGADGIVANGQNSLIPMATSTATVTVTSTATASSTTTATVTSVATVVVTSFVTQTAAITTTVWAGGCTTSVSVAPSTA